MPFTIYCHTNRRTRKKYVGQTCTTMMHRWAGHVHTALRGGRSYCRYFHRAIRKHGPDAFEHEVLQIVRTRKAANAAERAWIKRLNCRAPHGYNIEIGGGAGARSLETRAYIKEGWARMTVAERAARSAQIAHGWKSVTAEKREEITRKRLASMPSERRKAAAQKRLATIRAKGGFSAIVRKGWASLTPEERSERARRREMSKPPAVRSAQQRARWANMSSERRVEIGRKISETRRRGRDTRPTSDDG